MTPEPEKDEGHDTAAQMATSPARPKHSWKHEAYVVAFIGFRLINAYYVQTFFQPDEYFQALEPAWQLAFGRAGGAWITWEWKERLRTSVHPLLFSYAYTNTARLFADVLKTTTSTRASALVAAPRALQAYFAGSMDYAIWQTADRLYGSGTPASYAALMLTLLSPWQWFCSTRSFSNSLEAEFTARALLDFPWRWFLEPEKDDKIRVSFASLASVSLNDLTLPRVRQIYMASPRGLYRALFGAAAAFYLRPTNILIWIAISAGLLGCNRNYRKAAVLFQAACIAGSLVIAVFAVSDHGYYRQWTFPPVRFVYFNVVQSLAAFYGRNRPDYYITEGLPLLLTTALPFAGAGLWQSLRSGHAASPREYVERQTRFVFALTVLVTIFALSMIGHKEVRFLYPLLPMLLVLAAKPLATFFSPLPLPRSKLRQALLALMAATNIYIAGYVSMTHQRGVIDVVHYLRHRQEGWFESARQSGGLQLAAAPDITVAFLMPCHSTPWRSHLVYPNIRAWALTCEPPVYATPEQRESYMDEADVFYADPAKWIAENMQNPEVISSRADSDRERMPGEIYTGIREWPHYLVFFGQLEPTLNTVLADSRYKECRRFFNTHWHDDWRRKGDVVVWCMRR